MFPAFNGTQMEPWGPLFPPVRDTEETTFSRKQMVVGGIHRANHGAPRRQQNGSRDNLGHSGGLHPEVAGGGQVHLPKSVYNLWTMPRQGEQQSGTEVLPRMLWSVENYESQHATVTQSPSHRVPHSRDLACLGSTHSGGPASLLHWLRPQHAPPPFQAGLLPAASPALPAGHGQLRPPSILPVRTLAGPSPRPTLCVHRLSTPSARYSSP